MAARNTRAVDVRSEEGTVMVTRPNYSTREGVEEVTERISVPIFGDTPVARVRVEGSITRGLPDMNFVKVGVSIDLPALPTLEEVGRVYGIAAVWLDERLEAELADAIATRGPDHGESYPTAQPEAAPLGGGIVPVTGGR